MRRAFRPGINAGTVIVIDPLSEINSGDQCYGASAGVSLGSPAATFRWSPAPYFAAHLAAPAQTANRQESKLFCLGVNAKELAVCNRAGKTSAIEIAARVSPTSFTIHLVVCREAPGKGLDVSRPCGIELLQEVSKRTSTATVDGSNIIG